MADRRTTNWLLAGILVVLGMQIWMERSPAVQADTLRLDACITQRFNGTPDQYLHVVCHPPLE